MENNEKELNARGVLADLIAYRKGLNEIKEHKKSSWFKRLSFWIWVFGILLLAIGHFVRNNEITMPTEYVLIYLIVFLASLIGTAIFTYLDFSRDKEVRSFLKDPAADFLKVSDEILKDEIALYSSLDKYPLNALIQTRNYLTRKKSLIESISSMFVGVLTKIGILPAVVTVLVVIAKLNNDGGISLVSMVIFTSIGAYFICFRLIEAAIKFEEYQSILSDYIEMRQHGKLK